MEKWVKVHPNIWKTFLYAIAGIILQFTVGAFERIFPQLAHGVGVVVREATPILFISCTLFFSTGIFISIRGLFLIQDEQKSIDEEKEEKRREFVRLLYVSVLMTGCGALACYLSSSARDRLTR